MAMADPLLSIEDDPNIPAGSVVATEVLVTQFIRPDATVGTRTVYRGDGSLSQVLGLLVLAAIDIAGRVER